MMLDHSQQHPNERGDNLLNAAGVAEMLSVPTSWVYAQARAGRIPHIRIGRYRRFRREAVERWIEGHEWGPVR